MNGDVERRAEGDPMPIGVACAILSMGYSATRDRAQTWAREAERRGATPAELAAAWAAWERLQDELVTNIGGAP